MLGVCSACVFCNELFVARAKLDQETCVVSVYTIPRTSLGKETCGTCNAVPIAELPMRGLTGVITCDISVVAHSVTKLTVVVLSAFGNDRLWTFQYDKKARSFHPLTVIEVPYPTSSTYVITHGPRLAVLSDSKLALHSFTTGGYPELRRDACNPRIHQCGTGVS